MGALLGEYRRWTAQARLIGVARANPGITRVAAARALGISSGAAADLVARMRQLRLIDEIPAEVTGRGRPTTMLVAHAGGPLVLAAELGSTGWRLVEAGLDGTPQRLAESPAHVTFDNTLVHLAEAIGERFRRRARRVQVISLVVDDSVNRNSLSSPTPRGRADINFTALLAAYLPEHADVAIAVENATAAAGLAEARSSATQSAGASLYLEIGVGVQGALTVNRNLRTGAQNRAPEYGHLPFGDARHTCRCGARGCWDLSFDGGAVGRHQGDPAPQDPSAYLTDLLQKPAHDASTLRARHTMAASLGHGIAGLVNLHQPDEIVLGRVAGLVKAAAEESFAQSLTEGMMSARRDSPPTLRAGVHGADGPLRGAVELGLDHLTTESALATWSAQPGHPDSAR